MAIDFEEIDTLKSQLFSHMDRVAEFFHNGRFFNSDLFFEWDDFTPEQRKYVYTRINDTVNKTFDDKTFMPIINASLDICMWMTDNCDWVRERLHQLWRTKHKNRDYREVLSATIAFPIALHMLLGIAGCKSKFKLGVWIAYEVIESDRRKHISSIIEQLIKVSYHAKFNHTGSLCGSSYIYKNHVATERPL